MSLGEIATVFNGKTPAKADHRSEGFPVLKIKDVDENGRFRGNCESFVDRSLAEKFRQKWIEPNDILILNAAHNADYVASKIFFAGTDVGGHLPTGEWLLIRTAACNVLPRYVYHWIKTADARRAIRFIVKGIHLYPKDVAQLQISLPPLEEQRRIVGLLDRAAEIRRRADAARAKARAIIPALFLDMFGDPATNPRGWRALSLGDALLSGPQNGLYRPASDYGEGIRILRIDSFDDGIVSDQRNLKRLRIGAANIEKFGLREKDIVVNRVNSPPQLGKSVLVPDLEEPTVFESNMMRMRVNPEILVPAVVGSMLQLDSVRQALIRNAKHAINQSSINQGDVTGVVVFAPPLPLQTAFAEQAQRLEATAHALDAAAAKAEATAAALSAEVFGASPKGEGQR